MADLKISALTAATTPLAGTEVLPIVQGGVTTKVAVSDLTAGRAVTASSVNKVAITAPATASTLTIADGKTLAVNDNATLGTGGLTLGNSGGFTAAASKVLTANNSLTLAGTDATTHTFPTTSATIARTDAAQTFTGDQTISAGNLIPASGYGIDFSATPGTGTSELLADYEEGTWTPNLGGNATYTSQLGRYIIIGKQVTVFFDMTVNVLGTGSATTISGLPFTAAATAYSAMFSPYWSGTATAMISITGIASGTNIPITGTNSAATTAGYLPTIFQDSARLAGQMTYFI
jgi:hypothetical protein